MRCVEVIASTPHPGVSGVSWHSRSMIALPPMPLLLNHDPALRVGTVFAARVVCDRVMVEATIRDAYLWQRIVSGDCLAVSSCVASSAREVRGRMIYGTVLREVSLLLLCRPDNPECRVTRAWTEGERQEVRRTW